MEYSRAIEMLQGIAYVRGVLTQWVDDDADVIGICRVIEGRLWDEAEQAFEAVKAKTEKQEKPAKAPKPTADPGDDCASRKPAVEVIETKVRPKQDISMGDNDIVENRPECKKCRYRVKAGALVVCDYGQQTGKLRDNYASDCEVWKTARRGRSKAGVYRHICRMCGNEFESKGAGNRYCPECAEVRKRDAEEKRKQIEEQRQAR